MLYVSMPTFHTPRRLLQRAVRSVLAQTYPDLRLVVVCDGDRTVDLSAFDDHRLIRFDLSKNRGRYFADATVLAALNDDDWWSPHDSDDWSEPDRFEHLMAAAQHTGAAVAPHWSHRGERRTLSMPKMAGTGFRFTAHWCTGVYRKDVVLGIGGLGPQFRVGYDTLFTSLLPMVYDVAVDPVPGYHWVRRQNSLTTSNGTSFHSALREQTKMELRRMYDEAGHGHRRGRSVADIIANQCPAAVLAEVQRRSVELRTALQPEATNVPELQNRPMLR